MADDILEQEQETPEAEIAIGGSTIVASEAEEAAVRRWTKRIKNARERFKPDFDRMRKNMEFVFGLQWSQQKDLADDRYTANLTNKAINGKVAMLYAKDPKAVYRRRKRLEYQVWDEKLESLGSAIQRVSAETFHMMPPDAESQAIIQDYQQGQLRKQLVDKVGRTLEVVWDHQIDTQEPDFKTQMKQLVRRVTVCGVGYVKVSFERQHETAIDSSTVHSTLIERMKELKRLVEDFDEAGDSQNADAEQIRLLAMSLQSSVANPGPEQEGLTERLVFDFLPSTSLIIDPHCRNVKGFVGARWIAHELVLELDYINSYFELDIETGTDGAKDYGPDNREQNPQSDEAEQDSPPKMVCLWHVFDLDTKSTFFIVDGYKKYVQAPMPAEPQVKGFYPFAALTFNDCEVEEGQKATIFPPSDVDLMHHAQKEWNRTRDGLRSHRKARAPKWMVPKGVLSEADLDNIANGTPCEAIELESVTKQDDMEKILKPFPHEAIDPAVYDTKPLSDDIMFAVGAQEANMGPAKANVTATVGSIAEQSRMVLASSNVDDLDDFLSLLAKMGGEMLLREMSEQTVKQIAGPGAAWPVVNRNDFLNAIYLETVAASSGRPNKAIELQNARELGPLLLQAGANPMFLVRELVKRLDDRIDPEDAFPLVPQGPPNQVVQPPQPASSMGGPSVPQKKKEPTPKAQTPSASNAQ